MIYFYKTIKCVILMDVKYTKEGDLSCLDLS